MKKSKNIRISSRQELGETETDSNNLKLGVTDLGWALIDIGLASEDYSGLPPRYKNHLSLMLIETRERGRFWDAMRMIEDYARNNGYSGVVLRAESQSSLIDQDNLEKLYRKAGYSEISSDYIDFGDYDEDEAVFYAKDLDIIDGVISKISFRQKTAGKREAKKVSGLNFEEIKKRLISEGIDPTPEEIRARMLNEEYLVISEKQKNIINSIDISESQRKRVNEVESALIVIGAVLSNESESDAKSDIEVFEWYLETFELQPGDLGISDGDIKDIISIKKVYEKIYSEVADKKRKADELASATSDDIYISNEIVYDLGEGWRVVYVPAAGEMEPYPGYPNTSHDRILEGNKNGLCLGSETRYYQNNEDGKIYSVRDPGNKPRVTIRINSNILLEAKGKNNNPPDILGAKKADTWFKTVEGLSYEKSRDYQSFPPLNIEDARKRFVENSGLAYNHGWVPHWYNNGIKEIDEDVEEKIKLYDWAIIIGGFTKYPKFFDRVKPVVIQWCNKYLNGYDGAEDVIFEYHEIYKTYKKLPEMQLAVKKLSEGKRAHKFIELNLYKIEQYKQYIKNFSENFIAQDPAKFLERYLEELWAQPYLDLAAKNLAEKNPRYFLEYFSDKPWAQDYIYLAAKNAAEKDSVNFLNYFLEKPWAQDYIYLAAKNAAEKDSVNFLDYFLEKPWAQPYLDLAVKNLINNDSVNFLNYFLEKPWAQDYIYLAAKNAAEEDPISFLSYFLEKPWAQPYLGIAAKNLAEKDSVNLLNYFLEKPWAQDYIYLAAKNTAEEDPRSFLIDFSDEPWAQPYLGIAAKNLAEKNPVSFLINFSDEPWAQPYLGIAAKNAAENYAEIEPNYFLEYFSDKPWAQPYIDLAKYKLENKKTSNSIQAKLLKLSKFLKSNNLEEYNYLNYYKV